MEWILWSFFSAFSWAITPLFRKQISAYKVLSTPISAVFQAMGSLLLCCAIANTHLIILRDIEYRKSFAPIIFAILAGVLSSAGVFGQSMALRNGDASKVDAIGKLSIVIIYFLDVALGNAELSAGKSAGAVCMVIGAYMMVNF